MNLDQDFDRVIQQEFRGISDNLLWQDEHGEYRVFGRYRIRPELPGYRVFCSATDVGVFANTRHALSWCIADKHQNYNLARELLSLDQKLSLVTNDIDTRVAVGERSASSQFREDIEIKLEGKIIMKKRLQLQLTKCVNRAKYYQQRGSDNETARTGRKPDKTSR